MGFFNGLFGGIEENDNNSSGIEWEQLIDKSQLDIIDKISFDKPVFIFKHSTRCGISRMVLKQFESEFTLSDKFTPYYLDLLNYRDISNEVASRYNVVHQSPQLIVIRLGKTVYNASHNEISALDIQNL